LVGFAHAYDLTWLLAKAIDKAGVPDRKAIRKAMEELGPHEGLVSSYLRPFSPADHEALSRDHVFMARYNSDGLLVRVEGH
jgi:branched-chain amino acid transport system substrate-binding protein